MASTIWCNKAIQTETGIVIGINDELTFTSGAYSYTISLDEKTYRTNKNRFTSELVDAINVQLSEEPIDCFLGGVHDASPRLVLAFKSTYDNLSISGNGYDALIGSGLVFVP